ncbi:MAG: hypothetical protein IJH25_12610 [Clostridia bacterium]|nr:hypothetical protein [Clostridia bacterium]MBQ6122036.1 hypothetical protein [Clostridia bacterium]MBQ6326137.1 hypothetical protein [Clostridia bacterium]MBQ8964769.1 hypothetical protein [Clostridia bacterium]
MRRKRVTGRFFVFLLALLVIAFLILRPRLFPGSKETVIMMANADQRQTVDCVIIRDESVTLAESTARVEYISPENSLVTADTTVANLYATGYSESLLNSLETTRKKIQDYHKQLLANIVDSQLQELDQRVNRKAIEFKNLITRQTIGNLKTVASQLETEMVRRQEYLRQNKRGDSKLTKLYDEENTRLSSIQSWRTVSNADRDGVVSFYIDGYETDLTPDSLNALSIAQVRQVLAGERLENTRQTLNNGIYRIVNQNRWYVAVLYRGNTWTPMVGQDNYFIQMEGFDDLTYTASVYSVQKENDSTLAIFEVRDPIGPLIYRRTGKAQFSITLTGLSVRVEALYNENGQMGVWVYDVPGGTFVPVEVLSTDGSIAMIQPMVEGALQLGQTVLIK